MRKKCGIIFVLSGPSGSGKTTLYEGLLRDKTIKLTRSISCTTRPARRGERQGRDYFFISRGEFLRKKQNKQFLETQQVFSELYGTPHRFVRRTIHQGKDVLLCIDVKGALVVKRKYPQAIMIFIKPPSLEELSKRLDSRSTETLHKKALRLKVAKKELKYQRYYDYTVKNDKVNQALAKLKQIIKTERLRRC